MPKYKVVIRDLLLYTKEVIVDAPNKKEAYQFAETEWKSDCEWQSEFYKTISPIIKRIGA